MPGIEIAPVTTTSMPPDITDIDMPTSDGDNNTGTYTVLQIQQQTLCSLRLQQKVKPH